MKLVRAALFTLATLMALPAVAQTAPAAKPAASDMEILRQKLKADKKLLVSQNMQLTEAEAKAFWPIYDGYQKDLQQLNDRLGKLITTYAEAYKKGPVTNETAKKLMEESLAIDEAENKMRRDYAGKLDKAVQSMKAARYLQIESKIRALIKFELAANIPLVE
jgi:Lhr-like helicase